MSQVDRHIPDVVLERYLASLLKEDARAQVEAVLERSEADAARLEELRIDSEAFLVRHPPGPLVAHVEHVLRKGRKLQRSWWWALAVPALVGFVGFGAVSLPLVHSASRVDDTEAVAKGSGVVLRVHRKVDGGSAVVGAEEALAPGDVVRFEVRLAKPGYLAVVGRDAASQVTLFHAQEGYSAAPQSLGRSILPGAFELDERPGTEEVYALFSPVPFELAPVIQALQEGRPVSEALPVGVQVTTRVLERRESPSPSNSGSTAER